MAKVFDARRAIYVPATGGHPKNTEYRVAWGYEQWSKPTAVTKIQMVYNNKIAGMLSPSYPDGTIDEATVISALKLIKDGMGTNSKKSKQVLVRKALEEGKSKDDIVDLTENELFEMHVEINVKKGATISPMVSVELMREKKIEDNILEMLFAVEIVN
ncbi:hypothetical protein [Viridibacillus arvi]|uniref:hypothetical protein n=1 Tax=Viridibacillus arvi TaxID=263475 RepID=UPI003D26E706